MLAGVSDYGGRQPQFREANKSRTLIMHFQIFTQLYQPLLGSSVLSPEYCTFSESSQISETAHSDCSQSTHSSKLETLDRVSLTSTKKQL